MLLVFSAEDLLFSAAPATQFQLGGFGTPNPTLQVENNRWPSRAAEEVLAIITALRGKSFYFKYAPHAFILLRDFEKPSIQ